MLFHNHAGMTIGLRIKQARSRMGLARTELARLADVPYPTLAGLENGDQTSSTKLHLIAKALKVRPEWLESGSGPSDSTEQSEPADEWTNIKGYAMAVGLGSGREAEEYAETHNLKFRADSLARKRLRADNLAVLYGKGDSMLPRIREGDAILFDTTDTTPSDGELFVIAAEGAGNIEYNVKRCEIVDDMVFFRADNPTGDHNWRRAKAMSNKKHPITIVGRVRWIGSWEG